MPVWLVAIATLLGTALIADFPTKPGNVANDVLVFEASAFSAGAVTGVSERAGRLTLDSDAPSSLAYSDHPRFGMSESAVRDLPGPVALSDLTVDAAVPAGADAIVEVRGSIEGRWTEWREASDLEDLDGSSAVQLRATLLAAPAGASPRLRAVRMRAIPASFRILDGGPSSAPTTRVWATRIGLTGRTTANGHVVGEHDRFVALPSRRALSPRDRNDYSVRITYHGKTVDVPVWDIGPWNVHDDYWNSNREQFSELPRWTSQSEAAFFNGHNDGRDGMGRFITLPTSLDIADGTFWEDLSMTANDWVDVTFLWMDAPSPPTRATPRVLPKTPPPGAPAKSQGARSASYNAPRPAPQLYLPLVMAESKGWTTTWTIQNPTGGGVTGTTQLYSADGTPVSSHTFSLGPYGSSTFTPKDPLLGVPWGFLGSAAITASGPVAAIVNVDRVGSDRMAYEAFPDGAPNLVAPIVFKEYNGWSTGVTVQNLGPDPTSVEVEYLDDAGSAVATDADTIPSLGSRIFYQPATAGLPDGFAGSARVRSTDQQPLAALVNEVRGDGSAMAYPSIAQGADRFDVPLLFKHYNGWDTGLQVFNMGDGPATVRLTYQTSAQPIADSMTIEAGTAATIYQPADSRLPDGYAGSATVVGDRGSSLVGVVNEVRKGMPAAMNYVAGGAGSPFVTIPLVAKSLDGWDTGIQVRNGGSLAAQVTVSFYSEVGGAIHRVDAAIAPGATYTLYPPGIDRIPAGFRGSAIIQSMNRQPLTAIVNEVGPAQDAAGK